jgi:hypothetical protein
MNQTSPDTYFTGRNFTGQNFTQLNFTRQNFTRRNFTQKKFHQTNFHYFIINQLSRSRCVLECLQFVVTKIFLTPGCISGLVVFCVQQWSQFNIFPVPCRVWAHMSKLYFMDVLKCGNVIIMQIFLFGNILTLPVLIISLKYKHIKGIFWRFETIYALVLTKHVLINSNINLINCKPISFIKKIYIVLTKYMFPWCTFGIMWSYTSY